MTLKRAIQAAIFIVLHAAIGLSIMSLIEPTWMAGCGVIAAAFGTLLLFLLAGDEKSAKLFFFENWRELEEAGSPNLGLVFVLVGCIWLVPIFCLVLALIMVIISRSGWL
jgi:hypothetical protein